MADARDIIDQIEHAALQQIVVLNMATQSLRPRMDGESVTQEEAVVLAYMVAELSQTMLGWVEVLLGDTKNPCDVCGAGEDAGEVAP